ncbi:MAG TPA: M14 family zinc carboxypeptidase [Solirubrobacteraceae bacterium]|nr:M14 family zinc carboxypeptidase [Solirubrobacteraceae bacterium]
MTRLALLAALLVLAIAPAASASSLVEVPLPGPQSVGVLHRLGLDVTHHVTRTHARVVLHDEADERTLAAHFPYETLVADVEAALERSFARQQRRSTQRSALPSGRDQYRVLQTYYDDLDALAQAHPGLVRRISLPKESVEGREIAGVEIASNVNRTDDGRPVAAFFGIHHAREWASGEVNMEFALDLAQNYGSDPRITALLDRVRVFIVPVVNPDGFLVSRGPVEDAAGGSDPMHRRNCRPNNAAEAAVPCAARGATDGVDLNRNYGAGWGGYGASNNPTADTYRGSGPFSEPEAQAVHELSQRHQIMHVQSTHNIVGWVLRQPGFADYGPLSPDEHIMKPLGDLMGEATGYESLLGTDLYPVHGATEDWNYIAQGAMGYTIELGPDEDDEGGRLFFGPFQTHVVDQYLGGGTGGPPGKGIREAFLLAAEQAANPLDHGVLDGNAQPGATLRVRKDFQTMTSRLCPSTGMCDEDTERLPEMAIPDFIETTLTVPADGRFEWHVGPSTRPWLAAAGQTEAWVLTCEAGGSVLARREIVVARGERLTFEDACDAAAVVRSSRSPAPPPVPGSPGTRPETSPSPPRSMRLFVGPRRVPRWVLRRRGYLRVAMKVRGATVRDLTVGLIDSEREVLAEREFRRLLGRKAVRLSLPRVPRRGVYRLVLRGTADNGASITSGVTLRIVRR